MLTTVAVIYVVVFVKAQRFCEEDILENKHVNLSLWNANPRGFAQEFLVDIVQACLSSKFVGECQDKAQSPQAYMMKRFFGGEVATASVATRSSLAGGGVCPSYLHQHDYKLRRLSQTRTPDG